MKNTAKTTPKFEDVAPRLPVLDVEKALTFYIDQLGFQLGWKWGDPLTHASVCRDEVALDLIATPPDRAGMAMVYVRLSGIDAYYSELRGRGIDSSELVNKPYGMRDFEVIDPNGNKIAFGEPTAG